MTIQFRGYNGKSEMQEAREPSLRMTWFGPITLPHDLARLILAEQLYRAALLSEERFAMGRVRVG